MAQHHHLPATLRQRENRLQQNLQPLLALGALRDPWRLINQWQHRKLGKLLVRVPAPAPEQVDRRVTRSRKEKRPRARHPPALVSPQGPHIGFLHEIIVVGQCGKTFRQIRPERRFMGLDLLRKPAGLLESGHGVYREPKSFAVRPRFASPPHQSSAFFGNPPDRKYFQKSLTHFTAPCV